MSQDHLKIKLKPCLVEWGHLLQVTCISFFEPHTWTAHNKLMVFQMLYCKDSEIFDVDITMNGGAYAAATS